MRNFVALSVLSLFGLAACSGGGGSRPSVPATANAAPVTAPGAPTGVSPVGPLQGTGNLVVQAGASGGLPLYLQDGVRKPVARLRPQGLTFASVKVQAALYPGYAGATPVTNTQTIPVANGAFSVNMTFSNVPAGNNEWVVFNFYGLAADGSQIPLGQLGSLVNIPAGGTGSITVSEAATQRLEVFAALLLSGLIGSYDLANTPALDAQLASQIATTGVTPSTQTNLFTGQQLVTIANALAPAYRRGLTINLPAGAAPAVVSVVVDYNQPAEVNLLGIGYTFGSLIGYGSNAGIYNANFPTMYGSPFAGYSNSSVPIHTPALGPIAPALNYLNATMADVATGTSLVLANVYGGNIMVGGSSNGLPYQGGWASLGGRPPGTSSVSLAFASTAQAVTVNDPAGFAMRRPPLPTAAPSSSPAPSPAPTLGPVTFPQYAVVAIQPAGAVSQVQFNAFPCARCQISYGGPTTFNAGRVSIPANYSSTNNTLTVDTWNPWNQPVTNLHLCSGVTCAALSPAPATVQVARPFYDSITNLSFYGWQPGGSDATTSFTAPFGNTYQVNYAGGSTGSFTASNAAGLSATRFLPGQVVQLVTSLVPDGTVWTMTVVAGGTTYTASGVTSFGGTNLPLSSLSAPAAAGLAPATVTPTALSFQYQLPTNAPTSGSFYLFGLGTSNFTAYY